MNLKIFLKFFKQKFDKIYELNFFLKIQPNMHLFVKNSILFHHRSLRDYGDVIRKRKSTGKINQNKAFD